MFPALLLLAQTQRTVLMELFTSTWCPHCPAAREAADSVDRVKADTAVMLDYVLDLSSTLNPEIWSRWHFYGNGDTIWLPTTYIDATESPSNSYATYLYYVQTAQEEPAWCDFHNVIATYDPSSGVGQIEATVELLVNVTSAISNPRAYMAVAERGVSFGSEHSPHALRAFLPTVDGQALSITAAGDTQRFSASFSIGAGWEPESLEAYIWVQSADKMYLYNTLRVQMYSSRLNEEALGPGLYLRARGNEALLRLPREAEVELGLYDPSGRMIREVFRGRLGPGLHRLMLPELRGVGVLVARTPWGTLRAKYLGI